MAEHFFMEGKQMKRKKLFLFAALMLIMCTFFYGVHAASVDDLATDYESEYTLKVYFLAGTNGTRCLNVYANTPVSGNQLSSYAWSGSYTNPTQVWETISFSSTEGYEGKGLRPYNTSNLAINCYRGSTNPIANIREIIGNNCGDMDISELGAGTSGFDYLTVPPRTSNQPYTMYMFADSDYPLGNNQYKITWCHGTNYRSTFDVYFAN